MVFWNEIRLGLYMDRNNKCTHLMVESTNFGDENVLQAIVERSFPLIFFEALFHLFILLHSFLTATMRRDTEKHQKV